MCALAYGPLAGWSLKFRAGSLGASRSTAPSRLDRGRAHDNLAYFLERALRPYFDEAVRRLAAARDQLDDLTELALAQPPGTGPWSLKRFFAGDRPSRMAEWMDRPSVAWAARGEVRGISET